jgi:hypothetical protein
MSNRMDGKELLRDLIRKDEAEHLHDMLHKLCKEAVDSGEDQPSEYRRGFRDGLEEAMLIIDARIGHLRHRWDT